MGKNGHAGIIAVLPPFAIPHQPLLPLSDIAKLPTARIDEPLAIAVISQMIAFAWRLDCRHVWRQMC